MQIVSKRRDQHDEGKPPLTLYFIGSVGQGSEVPKLLSLTSFYVVHVKIYLSPMCPLQCLSYRAPAIRTLTAASFLGVWPASGGDQISGECYILEEELKYCNGGETSWPNIVTAVVGKVAKRARPIDSLAHPARRGCAGAPSQARLCCQ
jgi:hypothetical protein